MLTPRPRNQLLHSVEIFHDACRVIFVVLHIGARFTVEMLYVMCARFTVEMLYQLMLGLLWKSCMGLCSVLGGFGKLRLNSYDALN